MKTMRENPRRERPYVANGVLTVRHPWLNGRTIRLGMKKLENPIQYRRLFERLIAAHPRTEDEWREELPPSMRRAYFEPMMKPAVMAAANAVLNSAAISRTIARRDCFADDPRTKDLGIIAHTAIFELKEARARIQALEEIIRNKDRRIDELLTAMSLGADVEGGSRTTGRQGTKRPQHQRSDA